MTVTSTTALSDISANVNASRTRLAANQETFMKLLTTQMRNQDPLSPLDSTQFTQQLTQMTAVEQQIYGNQLLESLVSQGGGTLTNAVGLIGRSVTAQGSMTGLAGGSANWAYNLPTSAASVNLEVLDANGRTVWTGTSTQTGAGSHPFTWDGRNAQGQVQPDGDYRLVVSARNADNQPITASTYITGIVSAVQTVDGVTQLTIGRNRTPISSVIGVTAAS